MVWYTTSLILVALGVAACIGPPPQPTPLPPVPPRWSVPSASMEKISHGWLQDFAAPELEIMVAQALRDSPDLRSIHLRMEAARARILIADSARWPRVTLDADVQRSGTSSVQTTSHGLDTTVAWEVDLWQRLSLNRQGAEADWRATEADVRAARLALAAKVARGWFRVVETGGQIGLAQHHLENLRRALTVIEERYRMGLATTLDLRLARTDIAQGEERLASRRMELDEAKRTLETLLGRYPEGTLEERSSLPTRFRPVPAGLPAELLERRCDLVAARHRLDGATTRLEEARRNRLPTLKLTTTGGYSSPELRDLLDWDHLVWRLVGGLTQPLFQGGRLKGEEALARVEHQQAWTDYAKAVLNALREVETALAATPRIQERESALEDQVREANAAVTEAVARYQEGLIGLVTLLDTQRRAFTAESSRLSVARERLDNRIDLYLALGGDFGTQ
ncbi:MAG: TolC family protein [Magnetococcales bacterium]|nr:TolC family protein [Magnetococcales bacterium]